MKKMIAWFSAALMAAAILSPVGASAASAKTAEVYKGTPVVDAEMDEIWKTTKAYTVDTKPVIRDQSLDPDIDWNPRNVKGTFRLLWDEKNLYIYAEIADPYVKGAMDRFNVFVSPTNNKKEYQTSKPGQYDENAPQAYVSSDVFIKLERNKISASGPDGKIIPMGCFEKIKSGIIQKRKTQVGTNKGWVVEACIPWASGVSIKQGMTIGFDCEIDDQDTMDNGRGIVVWNQPNEEAWCNPAQTGLAVLKGAGNANQTDTSLTTATTKKNTTTSKKSDSTSGNTNDSQTTATSLTGSSETAGISVTDSSGTTADQIVNGDTQSTSTTGTTPLKDKGGNSSPWLWAGIGAVVVVLAGGGTGVYYYLKKKHG